MTAATGFHHLVVFTPEEQRAEAWDQGFIACRNHPHRRCNRSAFVKRRNRLCKWCLNHTAPGELREWKRNSNRRHAELVRRFGKLPKPHWSPPDEIREIDCMEVRRGKD